jgi:acetate kinase
MKTTAEKTAGSRNVLVFNCGSSSLKYRLIRMPEEKELAAGEAQRIGPKTAEPARIIHKQGGNVDTILAEMPGHAAAFEQVIAILQSRQSGEVDAVGHRVVHGADIFKKHILIDKKSLASLKKIQNIAPLHNPPSIALIEACYRLYPQLPQAAIFDTVFHATIPWQAGAYAIPRRLVHRFKIKKYGFHGTSHRYVAEEAAKILQKPLSELNAVSCHLGSGGASLCAIVKGESRDNTMGYSPLPGLVMSTRSGDIDPALALQISASGGKGFKGLETILNDQSGVLGMSGLSGDIRDILAAVNKPGAKNLRLELTMQAYLWRLRKHLGSYLAVVGRPDAVIFTDTIGETVPEVRWAACTGMEAFGLKIDMQKNETATRLPCDISADDSRVRALVIATNEELAIARFTQALLENAVLTRS